MKLEQQIILAVWTALGAGLVAALAELLHARRLRRLGRLSFGPEERPRPWTSAVPVLRVLAIAGGMGSLVILMAFEGSSRAQERKAAALRHVMILLDVSPSMQLEDAGETGHQKRTLRAAEILKSVMDRAAGDGVKFTMACFYSHALPLVKTCSDRELIWHFANDLPLYMAFRYGKTDLVKSLNQTGEFVADFERRSTTLLVLTDGDTVPDSGLKTLPSSVAEVILVGVGDSIRGTYIDGHLSRQDGASLSQLARRLGGRYHNGNSKHVPSEWLARLTAPDPRSEKFRFNLRILAIITLATSAAALCLLPMALEAFGTGWKPQAFSVARTGDRRKHEPLEVTA
jgi:Ca-activated chloride channel family protein